MKKKVYYQLVGSFFLIIFLFLSYMVYFTPQQLAPIDSLITGIVRSVYPTFNEPFILYTQLADTTILATLTALMISILYKKKLLIEALWLLVNVSGVAGIITPLLKTFFMRQRPTLPHLVTEHSYSFPSGHSVGSMLFYGTLIFIMPRLVKRKKIRFRIQVILATGILLIGISRIYLGVHFPSDVLGGFSLGLAWLFLTFPIYKKRRNMNTKLLKFIKKYLLQFL